MIFSVFLRIFFINNAFFWSNLKVNLFSMNKRITSALICTLVQCENLPVSYLVKSESQSPRSNYKTIKHGRQKEHSNFRNTKKELLPTTCCNNTIVMCTDAFLATRKWYGSRTPWFFVFLGNYDLYTKQAFVFS